MLNTIIITIGVILLIYALYEFVLYIMRRQSANTVEAYELMPIIRKVQVIDVREEPEFRAKHILGARNIPYSQFGQRYPEIRRDKPVYLYGHGNYTLSRAAHVLKKNGYAKENINILKGGMDEWPGKVKSQL